MTPLDVLVVESNPGAGRQEVDALEAAGHRVHRCSEPDEPGFPCRAVSGRGDCPLDAGIDVGLVVRRGVQPRPTEHEQGVSCIIRAGIPLLAEGTSILDPYAGFVTRRSSGDVAAECRSAVEDGFGPLREAISSRISHLLASAGHDGADVRIEFRRHGTGLRVSLHGPVIPERTRQAIGVRVLDALRGAGRTYGRVDVDYSAPPG